MRKRVELRVEDAHSVPEREQLLAKILPETPKEVLEHFLIETASRSSERYVELLEYISAGASRPSVVERLAAEEKILSLWRSAEPSLSDLYEYGGLYEDEEEEMYDLLGDLSNALNEGLAGRECRREITDNVFEYLEKDDYGTHELLYDIALSACADEDDLDYLSQTLEAQGDSLEEIYGPASMMKYYKKSGDREKYLAIRLENLHRSEDYLDLAEFHRDSGDWEEAMKVAEAGLEIGDGNKYTLRSFVIDRLEATGKRSRATELRFDQFFSAALFEEYLNFRRECSDEEWAAYEERVAERMKSARPDARLFYHVHRGESSDALTILLQHGRKLYWNSDVFAAAEKLEGAHPERMYDCYVRSMGNLYETAGRDVYALKARQMAAVRRVLVERLGEVAKWTAFAREVKKGNSRRAALQDEFAKVIPGWRKL